MYVRVCTCACTLHIHDTCFAVHTRMAASRNVRHNTAWHAGACNLCIFKMCGMRRCVCACIHACIHAYTHAYTHADPHTHTHSHTHTHTHTHTPHTYKKRRTTHKMRGATCATRCPGRGPPAAMATSTWNHGCGTSAAAWCERFARCAFANIVTGGCRSGIWRHT